MIGITVAPYTVRWESVHRIVYKLIHGEDSLPDDALVMHTCDNPPCCNPAHLRKGNYSDNSLDMWAKGRGRGKMKLNRDQVIALQQDRKGGLTYAELAKKYGVARGTAWRAANGRRIVYYA